MLNLTDQAVKKFKGFLEDQNCPNGGIRIFLAPGS